MNGILNLQQVFSQRVFAVPDYQRGYAWDLRQLQDLKNDLEVLPPHKDHFTGTLVLCSNPSQNPVRDDFGSAYEVVDVVDGQQRLTTLVILLDVIRRVVGETPTKKALAEGMRRQYHKTTDRAGQPLWKIRLNSDCRDFFERNILGDNPTADGARILSHRRLFQAQNFFNKWIQTECERRGSSAMKWLLSLYDKVTEQMKFSIYSVSDTAEVGVIFEVMNDRGKPLSELEKVKNYLLYVGAKLPFDHDLTEQVNKSWTNILERMMRAGLGRTDHEDRLLRAHWIACYDPRPRMWEGSRTVKEAFKVEANNHRELLMRLKRYVHSLSDASVAFTDAYEPSLESSYDRWSGKLERAHIVQWGQKLVRMETVANFVPAMIAARSSYADDANGFLELLEACELFSFRVYALIESRADRGTSDLYRLAHRIYTREISPMQFAKEVRELTRDICNKRTFKEAFALDRRANWYEWKALRYFFTEYEMHLSKGKPIALTWDKMAERTLQDTIEHILPQTLSSGWSKKFDSEMHKALVNDLGNLCITYDNSSYGNKDFAEKRGRQSQKEPCYANSSLYQVRELVNYSDWICKSIEDRRKKLVSWALKRWDIPT